MDPKELALEHFEKAILGVAGLVLVITAVGFVSKPKELSENQQLTSKLGEIESFMKTAKAPEPKPPQWTQRLEGQLAPSAVPSVEEYPKWVMHRRPQFVYDVAEAAPTHSATHRPPVDVQAEAAERGKVKVSWQASVENEYIIVREYEVQRRKGADGEWETIANVGGVENTYEDTNLESRSAYYYRVVSKAEIDRDNPVVRHEGMQLEAEDQTMVSAEAGPIETARDVFIIPVTVQAVTDQDLIMNPNATEQAYLKVWKWDADEGKFIGQTFTVKVGEEIGEVKKRGTKELDFRTNAVLVDVEIRARKHPTLGYDEQVQVIKYAFKGADGKVNKDKAEESNDKDKPAELEGK